MSRTKAANSDPTKQLALSASSIYFAAGLNIILGLSAFLFRVEFLQNLGFGMLSAALGLVLVGLGFLAQRRSTVALLLAALVFFLEGVAVLLLGVSHLLIAFGAGTSLHTLAEILQDQAVLVGVLTGWFILAIGWPLQILKGIGAVKKLKQGTPTVVS